jgi:hypothetical protein
MKITRAEKNEYFETTDLHLACAVSLFFPIKAIENTPNTNRSSFLFTREDGLDELVQKYWQNTLQVSPQQYAAQLRLVKTRLYESRRHQ